MPQRRSLINTHAYEVGHGLEAFNCIARRFLDGGTSTRLPGTRLEKPVLVACMNQERLGIPHEETAARVSCLEESKEECARCPRSAASEWIDNTRLHGEPFPCMELRHCLCAVPWIALYAICARNESEAGLYSVMSTILHTRILNDPSRSNPERSFILESWSEEPYSMLFAHVQVGLSLKIVELRK